MTETVNRKIDVTIEPSVGEVAKLIWSMDSDEQAFLLHQLAYHFGKNKMNGYMQMLNVADDVIRRNEVKVVGEFIDDLHEYLSKQGLTKSEEEMMAESEETDERG